MQIIITGSNSSVGKLISDFFKTKYDLLLLSSTVDKENTFYWKMGDDFPKVDSNIVIIHLAYDYSNSYDTNVTSLINSILQLDVDAHHIYFSSYSAKYSAKSKYGINKFALEEFFSSYKSTIIRPGLIVSNNGIYNRIYKLATKIPLIPLPLFENKCIPICEEHHIILCLDKLLFQIKHQKDYPSYINLYHDKYLSLRELFQNQMKITSIYIYFPYVIIYWSLLFFEFFGIKFSVTSDNFKGFFSNEHTK